MVNMVVMVVVRVMCDVRECFILYSIHTYHPQIKMCVKKCTIGSVQVLRQQFRGGLSRNADTGEGECL